MKPIIDVHTHFLPPIYTAALKRNVSGDPDGWPTPKWSVDTTLDFMHKNNITYSLLSLSSPHFNWGNKDETVQIAQETNHFGGELHRSYPSQLGYLASLPLPYEQDSIFAVNRALSEGAQGFTVPSNSRGIYWGSPLMDGVYQRLNEEKAVVLVHPNQPSQQPLNVNIGMPTPLMGFLMDTTMMFMNLLRYHFFDRFPDIRLIIPHAGAFLPILADRDAMFVQQKYHQDMFAALKHVYFDAAGAVFPRQLPMLLTLADEDHIVYGSDIPYTPLLISSQLLKLITDGQAAAGQKKLKQVTFARQHDALFKKTAQLAPIDTLLTTLQGMLAGASILTPTLKDKILYRNAQRLFAL